MDHAHTLAVAEEGAAGGQTDILAFDNRAQTCKVCSVPEDFGIKNGVFGMKESPVCITNNIN